MKKQTIIVTGASTGIGKEIAQHFLKHGDNVVLNSLNVEMLTRVFRELGGGKNLAMVAGNVSDRVTGIKLLATAVGKFGSADVLVNNAGTFETRSFFNVDEAYFDRFLDASIKGAFFTTQGIIPQMLKQGSGSVINIGMPLINHVSGGDENIALLASKGAIHSLTIHLAAEFGKHNIRFNTITPGTVGMPADRDTGNWGNGLNFSNYAGEVEDIAQMVYTIAKSNFITGAAIKI